MPTSNVNHNRSKNSTVSLIHSIFRHHTYHGCY